MEFLFNRKELYFRQNPILLLILGFVQHSSDHVFSIEHRGLISFLGISATNKILLAQVSPHQWFGQYPKFGVIFKSSQTKIQYCVILNVVTVTEEIAKLCSSQYFQWTIMLHDEWKQWQKFQEFLEGIIFRKCAQTPCAATLSSLRSEMKKRSDERCPVNSSQAPSVQICPQPALLLSLLRPDISSQTWLTKVMSNEAT